MHQLRVLSLNRIVECRLQSILKSLLFFFGFVGDCFFGKLLKHSCYRKVLKIKKYSEIRFSFFYFGIIAKVGKAS